MVALINHLLTYLLTYLTRPSHVVQLMFIQVAVGLYLRICMNFVTLSLKLYSVRSGIASVRCKKRQKSA